MSLIIIISCSEDQNNIESEDEVRFSDLEGILTNQCYRCHSESQYSFYGLNLDTYENTMAGSIHGSVVVPYNPEESLLYLNALMHQYLVIECRMITQIFL